MTLLVGSNGRGDGVLLSYGAFLDNSGDAHTIPGAADNATVYLQLEMWIGNATSYLAAELDPSAFVAQSPVFQNPSVAVGLLLLPRLR